MDKVLKSRLQNLAGLLAILLLNLLPLAAARHAYRTPRLILLGTSAVGSWVTGMTALLLEIPEEPEKERLFRMSLRIASPTFLGVLVVAYSLWYLSRAQKTQRFLYALCSIGLILWVFVHRDPSTDTVDKGDAFTWLDYLNLSNLIAVMAGILNAESRLIASAFAEGEADSIETDNNDPRHLQDPRDNRHDEENQSDTRNNYVNDSESNFISAVARNMPGI
ncbi:hypothetical protein B0T21DRAFT_407029 [Apiosordaria backusii]|uniref:Uncharacterized protein n=1 Tax=Apiosordaria backusii TaxID=314023 RepID=A0AA40EZQ7_9PEZI|nr:hypothetical protein B0T21DRAFT_407029 [Apiosordaria backusii]